MKLIVLIFCLLIGSSVSAQVDSEGEKIPDPHRFYGGVVFAPEFAGTYLLNHDEASQDIVEYFNEWYIPKPAYTAGLDFLFILNQRITIESGIQYSNKGFGTKKLSLTDMYGAPYDPEQIKSSYLYHYLEVPVKLNYNIHFTNLKLYFSAGVASAYLMSLESKTVSYYQSGTTAYSKQNVSIADSRKFNLLPALGAGLDFFINSKMTFRVEPSVRFSMLKLSSGSTITPILWNSGINFSYLFGL